MKKFLLLSGSILMIFASFFALAKNQEQDKILCSFERNGKNITYNADELKFYENSKLLTQKEVQNLFPDYEIILISHFDKNRKYKVTKKFFKPMKVLVLNDTNRTFHNFFIYPESSRDEVVEKYKNGEIKSLVTIYCKKNVRLKHFGGDEFEIVVK